MSTAFNDTQLIQFFLAGRQDAGNELTQRHYSGVFRTCCRFFKNREDALDMAQEIFMRVLAEGRIRQFRGESELASWLYVIASNACRRVLRCKIESKPVPLIPDCEADRRFGRRPPTPEEEVILGQEFDAWEARMRNLPPKYGRVLLLICLCACSAQEVSRMLSLSPSTAATRLQRGRELLYRAWLREEAGLRGMRRFGDSFGRGRRPTMRFGEVSSCIGNA